MARASNLFAAASFTLLIVGLVLSNFSKKSQMSVSWPGSHTGYIIGYQVPCYGLPGLFAIFACSYALRWIRLSEGAVNWHLWLSLAGVGMLGFALALFARVAAEGAGHQAGQGTLLAIAAGLFAGPAAFILGQFVLLLATIHTFVARH